MALRIGILLGGSYSGGCFSSQTQGESGQTETLPTIRQKALFSDVAVGVPFEAVGAASSAGAVNILFGSLTGLTATGGQ